MQRRTVGALEGRVQKSLSKLECFFAKLSASWLLLRCGVLCVPDAEFTTSVLVHWIPEESKNRRTPPVLKNWWELMVFVHWTSRQLIFDITCTVHYFCSVPRLPTLGIDMIHLIKNNYPFTPIY